MVSEASTSFKSRSPRTVMVVEDHKNSLMVLQKMLELLGIEVTPAENGREAVDIFARRSDFDLILMDLKMPVMDGYSAMVEIKKINPEMKIIAETAYALSGDDRKILSAGFDDYLPKPITLESLENIVKRNLPPK